MQDDQNIIDALTYIDEADKWRTIAEEEPCWDYAWDANNKAIDNLWQAEYALRKCKKCETCDGGCLVYKKVKNRQRHFVTLTYKPKEN